jgi:hypothetical protein
MGCVSSATSTERAAQSGLSVHPDGAKTAVVATYVRRRMPHGWYHIDACDADLAAFIHYLGLIGRRAPGCRAVSPHRRPRAIGGGARRPGRAHA